MTSSYSPSHSMALGLLFAWGLCTSFLAASGGRVDVGDMLIMDRFRSWQAEHNRTYATDGERRRRFEIYRRNVGYIEATNRRGGLTYVLGENQFADFTKEEFLANFTTPGQLSYVRRELITTRACQRASSDGEDLAEPPSSVDWRTKVSVTPVKPQQHCDKLTN